MTLPAEGHPTGRRLAVSTWSLHRTLGRPPIYGPDTAQPAWTRPADALPLLDLPAKLADFGISTLEICHFSLPSTALGTWPTCAPLTMPAWSSGRCSSTAATSLTRSTARATWRGSRIGCPWRGTGRHVRAVAGMQPPTPVTVDRSVTALRRIMDAAEQHGVHVMTENWHALMDGPDVVTEISTGCKAMWASVSTSVLARPGQIRGPGRHRPVRRLVPRQVRVRRSRHARRRRLRLLPEIVDAAGFAGPYTLIYDGADADEWRGWRWNGRWWRRSCSSREAGPILDPRASDLTGDEPSAMAQTAWFGRVNACKFLRQFDTAHRLEYLEGTRC
ncbi:MAG: hypothetical protein R3A10_21390 [Caldilineaceae bacterium]